MNRLRAQLAQLLAVLLGRVEVGQRQCSGWGQTCTQVPRTTYDAWLACKELMPNPRMRHSCGGVLRKVALDAEASR